VKGRECPLESSPLVGYVTSLHMYNCDWFYICINLETFDVLRRMFVCILLYSHFDLWVLSGL
jgi:hypothetical protein